MTSPGVTRFIKYSSVGASTFAFDLVLLFILTDVCGVNYVLASGAAFVIAVSINYVISRIYVFPGSLRSVHGGYINFILIALLGLVCVMGGMYVLVDWFALNYLVARVGVAGITGVWNYLMNLYVNFKVAGKHSG